MDDERHLPERNVSLTPAQADVLRKHLGRGTLSLDDAAILVGAPVEELEQHFQGRRARRDADGETRDGPRRRSRSSAYDPDEDADDGRRETGLHAPERRSRRAGGGGGRTWLWAGGALGAVAIAGVLALLSGVPQSLLFPPRGVSEHKDANATPAIEGLTAEPAPEAVPAEEAPAPAVDPATAEAPPEAIADPNADPALADPSAAPPPEAAAAAELPVPAAPEEVAPAVPVAEAEVPVEPAPEAPAFAAPAPAATPAPTAAPLAAVGPSATLYAARAAAVRDAPTAAGSTAIAQLKRGEAVSGALVAGADGKSSWLHIESGPGAGGYVSVANMADAPRPAIVQALGQPRTLVQAAALYAAPDEASAALDTLSPGISVLAAAEVAGGWIEINRRAGGVGYIRKEAFQ